MFKEALAGTASIAFALMVSQGHAQDSAEAESRCLQDLDQLNRQMIDEGYWLTGYRGVSWGWGGVGSTAVVPPSTPSETNEEAAIEPTVPDPALGDPYGPLEWATPPSSQLRILQSAAHVLAVRGEEDDCLGLVDHVRQVAEEYTSQLRKAGVTPEEIVSWRHEQLIAATPVTEQEMESSAEGIIGSELRNPRDEYLGTVDNIIFDRETGGIAYLVIARGGFLGMGESHVPVPWDRLRSTPGYGVFVADIRDEVMADAPSLDMSADDAPSQDDVQRATAEYWDEALPR